MEERRGETNERAKIHPKLTAKNPTILAPYANLRPFNSLTGAKTNGPAPSPNTYNAVVSVTIWEFGSEN